MSKERKAVVLLSGGLDSATTLAIALEEGRICHALTFRYGQRHAIEIERARKIAKTLGAESFRIAPIDLQMYGGSALTSNSIDVPKDREPDPNGSIPVTYVPARNTIFLAHALGLAEVVGAEEIWTGINAIDYSGYPDCRPEFIEAFERLANVATAAGVENRLHFSVMAPLLHKTKVEIIREGLRLGVDYSLTLSCYDPAGEEGIPCGLCEACRLRGAAFAQIGIKDPGIPVS